MDERWQKLRGRVEDGLTTAQFSIGLFVFLFVAVLMLSVETHRPTGSLFLDMLLWLFALLLTGWGVLRLARYLRQRAFGDEPPSHPVTTQDLLGHCVSVLAGPMLLIWFIPRLAELRPESAQELLQELRMRWVDALLVGIGVLLCVWPLRAFIRYVTRR